jgi:large subunit ribosomal protein L10
MLRAGKEEVVAELAERLRRSETLIVADYRGLSMKEIDALRTELLKHGARFSVVKNTLTRRAAEEAGADALLALLEGPTAIAFLESGGDPVAVAKVLNDVSRQTRILAVRGGILDGRPISEDDVKSLATLPPLDALRGQVLGAVTAPLLTVVGLFAGPLRDLIGLLDARVAQLEEQRPEAAAQEPAVAAEPAGQVPAAERPAAAEEIPEEAAADEQAEETYEETAPEPVAEATAPEAEQEGDE